jgi:hypothetical protein
MVEVGTGSDHEPMAVRIWINSTLFPVQRLGYLDVWLSGQSVLIATNLGVGLTVQECGTAIYK